MRLTIAANARWISSATCTSADTFTCYSPTPSGRAAISITDRGLALAPAAGPASGASSRPPTTARLFLDEVGLLPEGLQAKLLKALEDRAVRRLGSTRMEAIDVWIFTASNEDLAAAARERRFREDLYHRLAVVTLRLPALRERGHDALLLAERFLARACADYDLPPKRLASDASATLLAYPWPGNVCELANVIERVALLSEGSLVTAAILGLPALPDPPPPDPAEPAPSESAEPLDGTLGNVERAHLLQALRTSLWNVTRTARRLGISRDTLRYRIAKYGLRPEGSSSPPSAHRTGRRPDSVSPGRVTGDPHTRVRALGTVGA